MSLGSRINAVLLAVLAITASAGCASQPAPGGVTPAPPALTPAADGSQAQYSGYEGSPLQVMARFAQDVQADRQAYSAARPSLDSARTPLERALAHAELGAVFYGTSERLRATRDPQLVLFSEREEAVLVDAEASDRPAVVREAARVRARARLDWRLATGSDWTRLARVVIGHNLAMVKIADEHHLRHPEIESGRDRLAVLLRALASLQARLETEKPPAASKPTEE